MLIKVKYHRVREYAAVEPEEKPDEYKDVEEYSDDSEPVMPKNWPASGEVEFRNVTIKYDLDGPEILKNINLKFTAGERVAVVGRTGSGKSTVSLASSILDIICTWVLICEMCSWSCPYCVSPTSSPDRYFSTAWILPNSRAESSEKHLRSSRKKRCFSTETSGLT